MGDDLNFSEILKHLENAYSLTSKIWNDEGLPKVVNLACDLRLLGFDLTGYSQREADDRVAAALGEAHVKTAIQNRLAFLAAKDFANADRIRNELLEQGIQLKDGKDPVSGERVTTWEVKR